MGKGESEKFIQKKIMATDNILIQILGFLICAGFILFSGVKLAKYGDEIAEITGWGKAWVGLILMAAVTSLPELITGISSVTIINAPDLAAGGVFGSCVFNLMILSIIDIQVKQPITSVVKGSHLFTGLLAIILIGLSGIAILTDNLIPEILWFSPFSLILILVYLFAVRAIYHFDRMHLQTPVSEMKALDRKELKRTLLLYSGNAIIVIVAAFFLPLLGERIAEASGMGDTLFGTIFLAASTSLPELVVSIAAVRIQSYDIAVGNIFGSNLFNMLILGINDLFYTTGSVFRAISSEHLLSMIFIIIMSAVAGVGLMARSRKSVWKLGIDTFIILFLYLSMLLLLYVYR